MKLFSGLLVCVIVILVAYTFYLSAHRTHPLKQIFTQLTTSSDSMEFVNRPVRYVDGYIARYLNGCYAYLDAWPFYLTGFLSLKLVGFVGERNDMERSFALWALSMTRSCTQLFLILSQALYPLSQ